MKSAPSSLDSNQTHNKTHCIQENFQFFGDIEYEETSVYMYISARLTKEEGRIRLVGGIDSAWIVFLTPALNT